MAEALELDIEFARRLFPDSAWAWAFFENAGGSFVPQSVIDRLGAYMAETQVQPGASFHSPRPPPPGAWPRGSAASPR